MIDLIIGNKGSGKTKLLIERVNEALSQSEGNVVVVEKGQKLTYDINYKARLIDTDAYHISGFEAFYGFLSGICAGNYDVTHIFVDATFKIGGRNYENLADFLARVNDLAKESSTRFCFTISCGEEELPHRIFDFSAKINAE